MIIVAKGSLKSSLRADFLVPFPLLDNRETMDAFLS
jgi:hypothetical protein